LTLFIAYSISFYFFGRTEVWTQGFMFAKQVLYYLSHTPVHFAVVILEMGVS
jgi:hypothetical protein